MEGYITAKEAAERKDVTVTAIYKAVERGQLPCQRILGRIVLRLEDVDAYEPGSYAGKVRSVRRRGPGRSGGAGTDTGAVHS